MFYLMSFIFLCFCVIIIGWMVRGVDLEIILRMLVLLVWISIYIIFCIAYINIKY